VQRGSLLLIEIQLLMENNIFELKSMIEYYYLLILMEVSGYLSICKKDLQEKMNSLQTQMTMSRFAKLIFDCQ
jgi:hypothetical protein